MAINLVCSECKSNHSLKSKVCKKCGYHFEKERKYRVVVKGLDGKRISKMVENLVVAKKLESTFRSQMTERRLFGTIQSPIVKDVWEKYLSWAKEHKKSWKDDYDRWNLHIGPDLNHKIMNTVTGYDVHSLIQKMRLKRSYAPATVKHVIVLIRRVYNWASEMDLYSGENPAKKIKLPKINNQVTECLTKNEMKRLMNTLNQWNNQLAAMLVKFAIYTGLRRGELFNLKWDRVDLDGGWISLTDTKGGKDTVLPISDKALSVLNKAKELQPVPNCPFVFPNRLGNKRTSFSNTWIRIKKAANISTQFRFHGLRHTFASYLASSGKVSQYTLQKLLTHKTPQMTQRYTHLFDETLREGVNIFSTLV